MSEWWSRSVRAIAGRTPSAVATRGRKVLRRKDMLRDATQRRRTLWCHIKSGRVRPGWLKIVTSDCREPFESISPGHTTRPLKHC
jgi:hypothetical protein